MKNFIWIPILLLLLACSSERDRSKGNISVIESPIQITLENGNSNVPMGDTISITVSQRSGYQLKNITLTLNDSVEVSMDSFPFKWQYPTSSLNLGKSTIRVSAMGKDKVESKTKTFVVLSENPPVIYDYKRVNMYDHDNKAYTQGLIFHHGFLYEGTGQKGLSNLRRVELESGKVLEQKDLDDNVFGEGIALHDGKIYQLSWNSQVGFIYDINTLEEEGRFFYRGEGWGITSDGDFLYRTDGSNRIYIHNTGDFTELSHIDVYSNEKAIGNLNELEYIDGKIYANIWQKDEIAIINPSNGQLEGLIILKGLLPKKYRDKRTEVLNGIAYDAENDRLFVTGKNWSKLFEIEIMAR